MIKKPTFKSAFLLPDPRCVHHPRARPHSIGASFISQAGSNPVSPSNQHDQKAEIQVGFFVARSAVCISPAGAASLHRRVSHIAGRFESCLPKHKIKALRETDSLQFFCHRTSCRCHRVRLGAPFRPQGGKRWCATGAPYEITSTPQDRSVNVENFAPALRRASQSVRCSATPRPSGRCVIGCALAHRSGRRVGKHGAPHAHPMKSPTLHKTHRSTWKIPHLPHTTHHEPFDG